MFMHQRKIYGFECDIYGHLNNAAYQQIYEEARSEALDELGCSVADFKKLGIDLYLTRIELLFKKEIRLGSVITIKTMIKNSNRVRFTWQQKITDENGTLCNSAEISGAYVRNGKPTRITPDLAQQLTTGIDA